MIARPARGGRDSIVAVSKEDMMSLYSILVFLHIVGALGLFAGVGLGWAGLVNLRRATTTSQVREWAGLLSALRRVEGPAALVILVTGLYLGVARWGHQPWIGAGLLGLVLIAILGAILTGRRAAAITRSVPTEDGAIPAVLRRRLNDPVLWLSTWVRTALVLGIVFIMSVKPNAAGTLIAMGVALIVGLAVGFPASRALQA